MYVTFFTPYVFQYIPIDYKEDLICAIWSTTAYLLHVGIFWGFDDEYYDAIIIKDVHCV